MSLLDKLVGNSISTNISIGVDCDASALKPRAKSVSIFSLSKKHFSQHLHEKSIQDAESCTQTKIKKCMSILQSKLRPKYRKRMYEFWVTLEKIKKTKNQYKNLELIEALTAVESKIYNRHYQQQYLHLAFGNIDLRRRNKTGAELLKDVLKKAITNQYDFGFREIRQRENSSIKLELMLKPKLAIGLSSIKDNTRHNLFNNRDVKSAAIVKPIFKRSSIDPKSLQDAQITLTRQLIEYKNSQPLLPKNAHEFTNNQTPEYHDSTVLFITGLDGEPFGDRVGQQERTLKKQSGYRSPSVNRKSCFIDWQESDKKSSNSSWKKEKEALCQIIANLSNSSNKKKKEFKSTSLFCVTNHPQLRTQKRIISIPLKAETGDMDRDIEKQQSGYGIKKTISLRRRKNTKQLIDCYQTINVMENHSINDENIEMM